MLEDILRNKPEAGIALKAKLKKAQAFIEARAVFAASGPVSRGLPDRLMTGIKVDINASINKTDLRNYMIAYYKYISLPEVKLSRVPVSVVPGSVVPGSVVPGSATPDTSPENKNRNVNTTNDRAAQIVDESINQLVNGKQILLKDDNYIMKFRMENGIIKLNEKIVNRWR